MAACDDALSQLPEDITEAKVEEALRELLRSRADDADAYFLCARKHRELAEWIERNSK